MNTASLPQLLTLSAIWGGSFLVMRAAVPVLVTGFYSQALSRAREGGHG